MALSLSIDLYLALIIRLRSLSDIGLLLVVEGSFANYEALVRNPGRVTQEKRLHRQ